MKHRLFCINGRWTFLESFILFFLFPQALNYCFALSYVNQMSQLLLHILRQFSTSGLYPCMAMVRHQLHREICRLPIGTLFYYFALSPPGVRRVIEADACASCQDSVRLVKYALGDTERYKRTGPRLFDEDRYTVLWPVGVRVMEYEVTRATLGPRDIGSIDQDRWLNIEGRYARESFTVLPVPEWD